MIDNFREDDFEKRTYHQNTDGTKYILTESKVRHWQNSHFHKFCFETYVAQVGHMYIAQLQGVKAVFKVIQENESITFQPGQCHNIFLDKSAVIHTIKHGKIEKEDWFSCPELDKMTKLFQLEDLLHILNDNKDRKI